MGVTRRNVFLKRVLPLHYTDTDLKWLKSHFISVFRPSYLRNLYTFVLDDITFRSLFQICSNDDDPKWVSHFLLQCYGLKHHPPSTFAGRSAGPQLRRAGKKGQSLLGMVAATEERIIPAGYTHTYIYIIQSYSGACSGLQHCANVPFQLFFWLPGWHDRHQKH